MGYVDAQKDGIRSTGDWGTRYFYPHCCLCGEELLSMNYKSGVQYKCKSCKELIATDQKLEKQLDNREPQEKQLAKAIKVIGKQTDIEKYQKAIEKVAVEMQSGCVYDSSVEVMAAIELSRRDIAYRPQVKLGTYTADFILDDMKIVFEVDGVLYHTERTRQHEELRDGLIILSLGAEWQVVRITDELITKNITRLMPAIEKVVKKRNMLRQADGSLPKWYTDRKTS